MFSPGMLTITTVSDFLYCASVRSFCQLRVDNPTVYDKGLFKGTCATKLILSILMAYNYRVANSQMKRLQSVRFVSEVRRCNHVTPVLRRLPLASGMAASHFQHRCNGVEVNVALLLSMYINSALCFSIEKVRRSARGCSLANPAQLLRNCY